MTKVAVILCALFLLGLPQAQAQVETPIHVGENVHVSGAQSNYSLGEIFLNADPADANHLLACGVVYAQNQSKRWTTVYVSNDGGKTWSNTLDTHQFHDSADPACTIAPNGVASHVAIELRDQKYYALVVYNSRDGGRTWTRRADLPMKFQGIDNEFMTADSTTSPYRGYIYIGGESSIKSFEGPDRNGYAIWRSRDHGVTFDHPVKRSVGPERYALTMGDPKVMRDGTLITVFGDLLNSNGMGVTPASPGHPNATLNFVSSPDGGDSISEATKASDYYMPWDVPWDSEPRVAVDNTNGVFKDRIYVVFDDTRSGRGAIYAIHSDDKGKTWTPPVLVEDDVAFDRKGKGPNNFMPTLAVNRNGVVGVAWYDRRDFTKNEGWQVRFAASLDGGDTWSASVPVETVANRYDKLEHIFTYGQGTRDYANYNSPPKGTIQVQIGPQIRQFNAGDYAGLVADPAGVFHALWIDNRTGLSQIWTAPISVDGRAQRFGLAALSSYTDVSDDIAVYTENSDWDRATDDVTLTAHLVNIGKKTIRGPLRLRILSLSSALAQSAVVRDSDNGVSGSGAILNIDSAIPNGSLGPKQSSATFALHFHLNHVWPLDLTQDEPGSAITMSAQVLAHR